MWYDSNDGRRHAQGLFGSVDRRSSIADLTEAMGIGSPSLYAAFGLKEALYVAAIDHYVAAHKSTVWESFATAATAREAVKSFLFDSAVGLAQTEHGCMATLSAVGGEGNAALGACVAAARAHDLRQVEARIGLGIAQGDVSAGVDPHLLARFVQCVQNGMSLLVRDGATCAELSAVAETAMLGWDRRMDEAAGKCADQGARPRSGEPAV